MIQWLQFQILTCVEFMLEITFFKIMVIHGACFIYAEMFQSAIK